MNWTERGQNMAQLRAFASTMKTLYIASDHGIIV
jgi:hypothetical protein